MSSNNIQRDAPRLTIVAVGQVDFCTQNRIQNRLSKCKCVSVRRRITRGVSHRRRWSNSQEISSMRLIKRANMNACVAWKVSVPLKILLLIGLG